MAGRAPRLLFVVNHSDFFLSHRLPIALAAKERGYDVHVATMPTPAASRLSEFGLPWHELPLEVRSLNPLRDLVLLRHLYRLYERLRPDVVHHVTIKPVLYGGLAARLASVPAVVNALSGLGYVFLVGGLKGRVLRAGIQRMLRYALGHRNSVLILQNPDDASDFVSRRIVEEKRIVLIRGSGVDLNVFTPSPEPPEPPVVVLPSRMLWDKGVGEFVEAARILRENGVMARMVLAGDIDANNPASLTRGELEAWQREGHVEWWGHRTDMPEVFRQAHVVCLPSYREGLPKVLIEAAAAGRAIVTTDVPGCREIVRDGQNGLLVPVRNAGLLASALENVLGNRVLRQEMGAAGRRMAEAAFGIDLVIDHTLALYDRLLRQAGAVQADRLPEAGMGDADRPGAGERTSARAVNQIIP